MAQPLWKTVVTFSKTTNTELPYDAAIPFWIGMQKKLKQVLE
jgi:hypothetical protein